MVSSNAIFALSANPLARVGQRSGGDLEVERQHSGGRHDLRLRRSSWHAPGPENRSDFTGGHDPDGADLPIGTDVLTVEILGIHAGIGGVRRPAMVAIFSQVFLERGDTVPDTPVLQTGSAADRFIHSGFQAVETIACAPLYPKRRWRSRRHAFHTGDMEGVATRSRGRRVRAVVALLALGIGGAGFTTTGGIGFGAEGGVADLAIGGNTCLGGGAE
jgi:hypothetical protein